MSSWKAKKLCLFYFTFVIPNDVSKSGEWVCNKCGKTNKKSGAWANLLNHINRCIGDKYEEEYERLQPERSRITSFVLRVSEREKICIIGLSGLSWLRNLPLSIVDCPLTRTGICWKPICSKQLRKQILALCGVMKEDIQAKLPSQFTIIFDGWSEGTEHYIGISATYCITTGNTEKGDEIKSTMLSMRPLMTGEVTGMTAQDHLTHLSNVLQSPYGKAEENVVCLVGDNCSVTNKSMSRLLGVPLIGFSAHKLNLVVSKWISTQPNLESIIEKVAGVMKKAITFKVSAQVRKLTELQTVHANDTRWSSTCDMIGRFFRIQRELSALTELLPLVPTLLECDQLSKAFKHLGEFHQASNSWEVEEDEDEEDEEEEDEEDEEEEDQEDEEEEDQEEEEQEGEDEEEEEEVDDNNNLIRKHGTRKKQRRWGTWWLRSY